MQGSFGCLKEPYKEHLFPSSYETKNRSENHLLSFLISEANVEDIALILLAR